MDTKQFDKQKQTGNRDSDQRKPQKANLVPCFVDDTREFYHDLLMEQQEQQ